MELENLRIEQENNRDVLILYCNNKEYGKLTGPQKANIETNIENGYLDQYSNELIEAYKSKENCKRVLDNIGIEQFVMASNEFRNENAHFVKLAIDFYDVVSGK